MDGNFIVVETYPEVECKKTDIEKIAREVVQILQSAAESQNEAIVTA